MWGGGSDNTKTGIFEDSLVVGLDYETATKQGITNSHGEFEYTDGEDITFKLGEITLGTVKAASKVSTFDLGDSLTWDASSGKYSDLKIATLLQSLDNNQNPADGFIDLTGMIETTSGFAFDLENNLTQEILDTITGEAGKAPLRSNFSVDRHATTALYGSFTTAENGKLQLDSELYQADIDVGHLKIGAQTGISGSITNQDPIIVESDLTIISHSDLTVNPDSLDAKDGQVRNRINLYGATKKYEAGFGIRVRVKNNAFVYGITAYAEANENGVTTPFELTTLLAFGSTQIVKGTEYSTKLEYDPENKLMNGFINGTKVLYWDFDPDETTTDFRAYVENRANFRGDISVAMPGEKFTSTLDNLSIKANGQSYDADYQTRTSW